MKLIFGRKIKSENCITLVECASIIPKNGKLDEKFNKFFVSFVKKLGINENLQSFSSSETKDVGSVMAKHVRE